MLDKISNSIKSMIKNNSKHLLLLLLVVFVVWSGLYGIDFGNHWDEHIFLISVTRSLLSQDGTLLPTWYDYPGVVYNLALASLIQDVPDVINSTADNQRQKMNKLALISKSDAFKLRVRKVCLVVSCLSLFWVYFLVLAWRKNWVEALLSASLVGLSWEFAYHARFTAPDVIMMQFGALTMMCLFFSCNGKKTRLWLRFAAISAGLACGTKYPGGLFLVPVLMGAYFNLKDSETKKSLFYDFLRILSFFVLTYLITTPGTIIEPVKFYNGVYKVWHEYGTLGHWGYTVNSGLPHLIHILSYFNFVVFSKYIPIAYFFFVMAVIGLVPLFKNERKKGVIFSLFPHFIYYIYEFSESNDSEKSYCIDSIFCHACLERMHIFS